MKPEAHWSKDYIEHLRATHFFLVLVCVPCIIFSLTPTKAQMLSAQHQLRTVEAFVKNQNDLIKKETERTNLISEKGYVTFEIQKQKYFVKVPKSTNLIPICENGKATGRFRIIKAWAEGFQQIDSLGDFIREWNSSRCEAAQILSVDRIVPSLFTGTNEPRIPIEYFSGPGTELVTRNYNFIAVDAAIPVSEDEQAKLSKIAASDTNPPIDFSLSIGADPKFYAIPILQVHAALLFHASRLPSFFKPLDEAHFQDVAPCYKSFRACFRDLSKITEDKTTWPFKDVDEAVAADIANSEHQFELGGIKFPSEDLSLEELS